MATYNNIALLGVDFIAIYGTTTYNEISGILANDQMVVVKVNYDTDKYRYAQLTDQTDVEGDTNYYTFTCTLGKTIYTYRISDADVWTTTTYTITDDNIIIIDSDDTTTPLSWYIGQDTTKFWDDLQTKMVVLRNSAMGLNPLYLSEIYRGVGPSAAGAYAIFKSIDRHYTLNGQATYGYNAVRYYKGDVTTGDYLTPEYKEMPQAPDTTNDYELTCKSGSVAWTTPSSGSKLYKHNIILKCYGSDISSLVTVEFETINNISTSITTLEDFVDLLVPDYVYVVPTGDTSGNNMIASMKTNSQYQGSLYINGMSKTTLQSISDTVTEL